MKHLSATGTEILGLPSPSHLSCCALCQGESCGPCPVPADTPAGILNTKGEKGETGVGQKGEQVSLVITQVGLDVPV